ncbi:hypothetical protein [uncultured Roseovarius sp.]|uniref:phage tail terminator protein n=1 Tax=uncultured Roseovarius sp. TaxID=293344 RepID=UPI002619A36D|nr:hypothetical protein [uncultured Roseovarius sp.]
MIDAVIARLEAEVPELTGRVDGGRAFVDLIRSKKLPARSIAAYVFPSGIQGARADAASGAYTQMLTHRTSIVLFVQSFDRTGSTALDRIDALLMRVVRGIAGWAPGDEVGVYRFERGQLVESGAGRLAYQLDFSIDDQLRILS